MNNIEQEAKEYITQKKKKLSAADRTVLRAYLSVYLANMLVAGRGLRHEEALQEAYQHALRCLEFEKTNF